MRARRSTLHRLRHRENRTPTRLSPPRPSPPRRIPSRRILATLRRVSAALELVLDPAEAMWVTHVGFTAGEGLGFNRAFLLLRQDDHMRGWFGVGVKSREDAAAVWSELRRKNFRPLDHLDHPDGATIEAERRRHADTLDRLSHPIVAGCTWLGGAFIGRGLHPHPCVRHWVQVLDSPALVVVPMHAGDRPWGVIIADNFVTRSPIGPSLLQASETLTHGLRVALERTQLVERLERERKQRLAAEQAAALLEAARGVAHDLKNPLALAGGMARELAESPPADSGTLERHLRVIAAAVMRAEDRVGNLAETIASKAVEVSVEAVEVGEACDRAVEMFRAMATNQNVRLLCYHPSRPILAAATPSSLERCMENLLGNALQALTGTGGTVRVAIREEDQWVAIEVADNGPPLPPGLRVDPFSGGVSTHRGGSGLGLASVRRLVSALHGRIEYDDGEPGWVRFTIYLRRWA